jgi:beta-lactam-binding protein with PASTA domain
MSCFEPCLRILRLAPYLVALAFPLASMAQPVACSRLPQAEQAQARESGLCVDDSATAVAKKARVLTPEAAARAAAVAAAIAASSAKGARPRFQCAVLPDFATRQSTYEQAVQALPRGLFRPRIVKRSPSSAPAGVVIAQSTEPLDGNLCWASFVLSDGSLVLATTIAVPDVVGRSVGEARTLLARFVVDARPKESVRPAGEVLAQLPPGGTQARPGSGVALTISDGAFVEVPDLVKRPLTQARLLLEQAGLRIATVDDSSGAGVGTVTTQQPLARTEVRRDSVVTLHVSAGLSLPGVVGRSLGDAQAALRSFVVHEERVASDRAEGEVLAQSPPAGTRVAARSRVTLSVSDGSIVTVPPLRGATLADARAALQRAGDLQAATPNGDEPGTMLVETSSPSAGIRVRRSSTVSLTLVPLTPWRAWAAGIATLLVFGGAGLYKWRKRKPSSPSPPGPDFHFSPSIEFNVRPIEARAGGPLVPEVGLRAELVVGRPWARQKEESP